MKPGFYRTAALLAALILGALLPQAAVALPLVQWLIMVMLLLIFLQVRVTRDALHRSHFVLLAANLAMGFAGWGLGWLVGGREVGLAVFFAGITPTASAAPVVTGFLRGRTEYVIASFLLTNLVISALMPVLLPLVLGHATPELFHDVLTKIGVVVFGPLALAWLLRLVYPPSSAWPRRLGNASFGLWVLALFLITANAGSFLRQHADLSHTVLLEIAVLSALVCAANFGLGRLIGGRTFPREASQSLGQKNTSLTIYLALTFASPLVALGPTFYVLWHNLWNSWQLHRQHRLAPPPGP